ncbi:hypothetical protein PoB_006531900 [Plakobranchus ocellatus]|uniref:Uncharacterized protein n=1 Tax=Plakobranchus ocellatus TaxID=259542 RepID=A0AAV4D3R1_9GAST|nr:hypothetical protein PoB_006531900 [Plakobranchus ocellatus]
MDLVTWRGQRPRSSVDGCAYGSFYVRSKAGCTGAKWNLMTGGWRHVQPHDWSMASSCNLMTGRWRQGQLRDWSMALSNLMTGRWRQVKPHDWSMAPSATS